MTRADRVRVTIADEGEGWFAGDAGKITGTLVGSPIVVAVPGYARAARVEWSTVALDDPLELQERGHPTFSGLGHGRYSHALVAPRFGERITGAGGWSCFVKLVREGEPLPRTAEDVDALPPRVWAACTTEPAPVADPLLDEVISHPRRTRVETSLYVAGVVLLLYAVLGNYVALPGYLRFLERGGRSESGNAFDAAVLFGALKTILWMYSFQLGILALVFARSVRERLHTKPIVVLAAIWLVFWSWPSLPAPGRWFYLVFGGLVLIGIVATLAQPPAEATGRLSRTLFLAALAFFAAATWEVCGLGSTGRMLHPEQAARPLAHNILVTQSSKLMLELLFGWSLMLASALLARRARA